MILAFVKPITLENGYTAELWAIEMAAGKLNNEGEALGLEAPRKVPFEITLYKDLATWSGGGRKIENPSFVRELLAKDENGNEIAPVLQGYVPLTLQEIDGANTLSIFANRIKELYPFFSDAETVDI